MTEEAGDLADEVGLEDSEDDTFMKKYERRDKIAINDDTSLEESSKPGRKAPVRDPQLGPAEQLMS